MHTLYTTYSVALKDYMYMYMYLRCQKGKQGLLIH